MGSCPPAPRAAVLWQLRRRRSRAGSRGEGGGGYVSLTSEVCHCWYKRSICARYSAGDLALDHLLRRDRLGRVVVLDRAGRDRDRRDGARRRGPRLVDDRDVQPQQLVLTIGLHWRHNEQFAERFGAAIRVPAASSSATRALAAGRRPSPTRPATRSRPALPPSRSGESHRTRPPCTSPTATARCRSPTGFLRAKGRSAALVHARLPAWRRPSDREERAARLAARALDRDWGHAAPGPRRPDRVRGPGRR